MQSQHLINLYMPAVCTLACCACSWGLAARAIRVCTVRKVWVLASTDWSAVHCWLRLFTGRGDLYRSTGRQAVSGATLNFTAAVECGCIFHAGQHQKLELYLSHN